jgi:putative membrane protein
MTSREALWTTWSWLPLPALLATGFVYVVGLGRLWRKRGGERAVGRGRAVAFFAGLVVLGAALVSPLHHAGNELLSAHMLQHLLLILVAAPLLALGSPQLPFLLSLPRSWRHALHAAGASGPGRAGRRLLTAPVVVWLVEIVVLWAWHLPVLYEAATRHEWIHTLEHLSFIGSGYLFWWMVLQPPGRRLAPGVDVLYVFTAAIASGALGALFAFAGSPIYSTYAIRAAALHVSALADQQLAGLVMWIPAFVVYLGIAGWLFVRWLRHVEREALRTDARSSGTDGQPSGTVAVEPPGRESMLTRGYRR